MKLGSLSRILRCCKRIFEPEVAWVDLLNEIPEASRSRYHRLNIQLNGPEISIDDITSIQPLREQTRKSITTNSQLQSIRDSLFASMFYFELQETPKFINGEFECKGYIYCRVDLPKTGREYLYEELIRTSSFFLVSGCPIACVNKVFKSAPPFRREIRFSTNFLTDIVYISIRGITSKPVSISGLPRPLNDLIRVQKFHVPFGRVDHVQEEKSLPNTPVKRNIEKIS